MHVCNLRRYFVLVLSTILVKANLPATKLRVFRTMSHANNFTGCRTATGLFGRRHSRTLEQQSGTNCPVRQLVKLVVIFRSSCVAQFVETVAMKLDLTGSLARIGAFKRVIEIQQIVMCSQTEDAGMENRRLNP